VGVDEFYTCPGLTFDTWPITPHNWRLGVLVTGGTEGVAAILLLKHASRLRTSLKRLLGKGLSAQLPEYAQAARYARQASASLLVGSMYGANSNFAREPPTKSAFHRLEIHAANRAIASTYNAKEQVGASPT
jgi:hypothetical protein